LQKLGIPTEIATRKKAYYLTPIDDMAQGDSFHIMPGVNKNDYGAAHANAAGMTWGQFGLPAADAWQTNVYDERKVLSTGKTIFLVSI
jgi:hypothetical protein